MSLIQRTKYWADWLFRDLRVRKGGYVIGEPANLSIIIFTISLILSLLTYKGWLHNGFTLIAFAALTYWGIREVTSGHSRFRKLLGIMALLALVGAVYLYTRL